MAKETTAQALRPGFKLQSKERIYEIIKVLGSGSFGITYLATANISIGNISMAMRFAIKEHFISASCYRGDDGATVLAVPTAKSDVAYSRADFITEANRLKKLCLKSRNIVSVNETFEANGTAYYVMEYLDGGSPSRCQEKDAVSIVMQIAAALEKIHEEHVLHLDIKPDNIVLNTNEKNETYPVLIDFGISKHFDSKGRPTSSLSAKGASPGFAPQEQYAGVSEFSPKYDIYALGAVLFFLCTGKNPPDAFKVSPNQQELKKELVGKVSPKVEEAILNAMRPAAFERTPSIKQFCHDLGGSGGTVPIPSGPTWWERNRRRVCQASGILLAGCFVFGLCVLLKPDPEKGSGLLTEAIEAMDGKTLRKFAEKDSIRAYLPFAQFLYKQGNREEALQYANKASALGEPTSLLAEELLTILNAEPGNLQENAVADSIQVIQQPSPVAESIQVIQQPSPVADSIQVIQQPSPVARTGQLDVSYKPIDSEVWLDGRKLGTTPDVFSEIIIGQHQVEIRKSGYVSEKKAVTIKEGQTFSLTGVLEKELSGSGSRPASTYINGHEAVDLGLSVRWATSNVGASSPGDYGNHYAWGETSTKQEYTKKKSKTYGKSCGDIGGDPSLDAARANWGGTWRLPTKAEIGELLDKCTWKWTTQGGSKGYSVTGKNGNSIFLPAAGLRKGSSRNLAGEYGRYWGSTPGSDTKLAYGLLFISVGGRSTNRYYRSLGLSVRPVSE